ncbi:MAG: HAD family phosphatase [Chlamydiota bacterium]
MSWIFDYSPIFFDLDGLLVNTEHLHFKAYREMLHGNGVSFPWDFPSFAAAAHNSAEGLYELIASHAPSLVSSKTWETLYNEKKNEYAKLLKAESPDLMPGASMILETVRKGKIPHAVVTHSTEKQTEMIREKIPDLDRIPHWITRENYRNPKPAPDAYLKAAELLGQSEKMLGFEDTLRGIRALEGAAITPVLVCPSDHPQMAEVPKNSLRYFPSLTTLFD